MKDDNLDILYQLGKRIAYLRKERHLSQLTLSLDSKVAKNYISDLENGRRNPTVKVLERIAKALRVTMEELFRGVVGLEQLF
jgi:transcriptional regulator with XRE-family HTH domain